MPWNGYKVRRIENRYTPGAREPYPLSRSKLERFLECPRCFWLEARHGIGRPETPPFTLNNAVDELLKREFDIRRAKGEPHPLMKSYGIAAVPYQHEALEAWRDALRRGIQHLDSETNLLVRGGIDDLWQNDAGELHVVDYKATAGKREITLDDKWKMSYKRQVEVYQWLFRANGFTVSPIAYFVYANGRSDREAFDGKLEFDITVLPYEGDDSWVHPAVREAKACLEAEAIPDAGVRCEYCPYREHAGKKLQEVHRSGRRAKA